MSRGEVVITGVGVVGSFGFGTEQLAKLLAGDAPVLSRVEGSLASRRPGGARGAALVGKADFSRWLAPTVARRMSPPSKFAVAAARMAIEDAAKEGAEVAASRTAVVMATAWGAVSFTEKLLQQIFLEGPEAASPFLFTECVANAPAAQVAIACLATGPNITITQREAGPVLALVRAAEEIRTGRVLRALAGSVDEMSSTLHAVLDRFGALTRPNAEFCEERARPFDRRRDGFLASEGATVLVLESLDSARARGARILARLVACGAGFDPTAASVGWGNGFESLGASLHRRLRAASLSPEEIDLIVSGASGSPAGDRLEALMLRTAWAGRPLPTVLAPKGVTGEYGGSQLAAGVMAFSGPRFGATAGFGESDPELEIVPHDGRDLPPPRKVLLSSLATGGAAAWAVLERAGAEGGSGDA